MIYIDWLLTINGISNCYTVTTPIIKELYLAFTYKDYKSLTIDIIV